MNFRMIQAVINCFERSTVERIEENSNVSRCLFIRCKYGHCEMTNKKLINRRNDITQGWQFCSSLISPWKRKKKKEKVITTRGIRSRSPSQVLPAANRAQLCWADGSRRCPCGIVTTLTVFSKMRKGIKKRINLWYCTAGKVVRDKKLEKYENENYYFLWWSDKRHFPYNCLCLTDEDDSVSRTNNFVNVTVFNTVTSARVLSYGWVLHYFSTIPVGRIKIVAIYKRSIFQVEWLIATFILCFSHCLESDSVSSRVFL